MSDLRIDWSSAEVADGTLELTLSETPPDGWKETFERTLSLLHPGDWGEIKLKKGRIRVNEVGEGSEDSLRLLLESLVEQANATDAERRAAEDQSETTEAGRRDAEMADRFRAFADA